MKQFIFLFSILFSLHFAEASVPRKFSVITPTDSTKTLEKASVPTEEKAFKISEGGSVAIILAAIASFIIILSETSHDGSIDDEDDHNAIIGLFALITFALGILSIINKLIARNRAKKTGKNNKEKEALARRFFAKQYALIGLAFVLIALAAGGAANIVFLIAAFTILTLGYGLFGYLGTQIGLNAAKRKEKK